MSCFKKLLEYNLSDTELEEDPVHLWHRIVERTVHPSTTLWLLTRGKRGGGRPLKRPSSSSPLVASLLAVKCDSHAPLHRSLPRFVPPSLLLFTLKTFSLDRRHCRSPIRPSERSRILHGCSASCGLNSAGHTSWKLRIVFVVAFVSITSDLRHFC